MHPIRAITLDLDDTLWDIGPVITRAEHKIYEQKRFNELAEVQRLEEKENRHLQEQQRRTRQYEVVMDQ